jgi:hypothetical protein
MTMLTTRSRSVRSDGRVFERALGRGDGQVDCPRLGAVAESLCDGCPYQCGPAASPPGVMCSYPFAAADTFARRARSNAGVRIALGHSLERT